MKPIRNVDFVFEHSVKLLASKACDSFSFVAQNEGQKEKRKLIRLTCVIEPGDHAVILASDWDTLPANRRAA